MHGHYFFSILKCMPLSRPVYEVHARKPLCSHHELHTIVLDQYTNSMHGDYFFLHRELHAILIDRYTKPMYRICFFPHRELHTIVLDWKTKFMHGDYIFPIVSYIPLSRPVHKVHARRLLFPIFSSYYCLRPVNKGHARILLFPRRELQTIV